LYNYPFARDLGFKETNFLSVKIFLAITRRACFALAQRFPAGCEGPVWTKGECALGKATSHDIRGNRQSVSGRAAGHVASRISRRMQQE
jgi:hypothetical protein